jgi:transposase
MDDINDDAKGDYRRVEILSGPERRRRWSADEKSRIVAESLVPGAVVSQVARRWQVCRQQIFAWRRELATQISAGGCGDPAGPAFVPVVAEMPTPARIAPLPASSVPVAAPPGIEIDINGARIRVASGVDANTLAAVLRAVRAAAS